MQQKKSFPSSLEDTQAPLIERFHAAKVLPIYRPEAVQEQARQYQQEGRNAKTIAASALSHVECYLRLALSTQQVAGRLRAEDIKVPGVETIYQHSLLRSKRSVANVIAVVVSDEGVLPTGSVLSNEPALWIRKAALVIGKEIQSLVKTTKGLW